jgi:plasmid stability protein
MPQAVTIRQIPDDVHRALKDRAARSGRSVEAEIRHILAENCLPAPHHEAWLTGLAERARIRTGPKPQTDSATLIRQERDARLG